MARFNCTLDNVRVAAPCNVEWDSMFGNERMRFCSQCKLNVYNLSEMTKNEAEQLISRSEGRLCIRYYKRMDGSILTRNCPIGLQAIKRRVKRVASAIGTAVVTFIAGLGIYGLTDRRPFSSHYETGEMVIGEPSESITTPLIVTPVTGTYAAPVMMGRVVLEPKVKRRLHR